MECDYHHHHLETARFCPNVEDFGEEGGADQTVYRISAVAYGAIAAVAAFFSSLAFGASFPAACVISIFTGIGVGVYGNKAGVDREV